MSIVSGLTIPPDIMIERPLSTLSFVSIISVFFVIIKYPEVGLGVVGTKRL